VKDLEFEYGPILDALDLDDLAELADDCLIHGRDGFELRVFLDLRRRKARDHVVRPKLLKALADKLNAPPGQKSIPF